MKILLINANPVVSRLLELCTRHEDIILDEVKSVDALQEADYDLLFINEASYEEKVDLLLANKRIRKKVFISYDEDPKEGFDLTIKKPFLPSQITEVIESVDMSEEIGQSDEEILPSVLESIEEELYVEEPLPSIFPLSSEELEESEEVLEVVQSSAPEVLDSKEIEKIKALLDMDDEIAADAPISDDEYEARKVKVIKEQLIAEGLEIIEEDAIVEELSTAAPQTDKKVEKSKKKQKKEGEFSQKERAQIEAAVEAALGKMKPKKIKKLRKGKKIEIKIKLEDEE